MPEYRKRCFVVMPFSTELHYFYLYMKRHLEEVHGIECVRADEQVQSGFMTEKVIGLIRDADVLIADIAGRNANVFYELGIAHDQDKKVIIITRDSPSEAPTDIKHYELIPYQLVHDDEFFRKLDLAVSNAFRGDYQKIYAKARDIYWIFQAETSWRPRTVDEHTFIQRVMSAEQTEGLPPLDDERAVAHFTLSRIIADMSDLQLVAQIMAWLGARYGQEDQ